MMHILALKHLEIKHYELWSCRSHRVLQIWYKIYLHRTSFERRMKIFLQSIIAGSCPEPAVIVSADWSQEPTVMTPMSLSGDLSLPIQDTNQQRRVISAGFRENGSEGKFYSSVCNLISKSFKLCHRILAKSCVLAKRLQQEKIGPSCTCRGHILIISCRSNLAWYI